MIDTEGRFVGRIDEEQDWYVEIEVREGTVIGSWRLDPGPSLRLANHSPDGFAWGYGGSGPSQLALAMLLYVSESPETALHLYQDFKRKHIATLDMDKGWEMSFDQVREFIRGK